MEQVNKVIVSVLFPTTAAQQKLSWLTLIKQTGPTSAQMYRLPGFESLPNRAEVLHTDEPDGPSQISVRGPQSCWSCEERTISAAWLYFGGGPESPPIKNTQRYTLFGCADYA